MKNYTPKPIDISDVELTDDLNELREAIAENAHDVWAQNRQNQGWTYGPQRDDEKLLHPDMIPYGDLPETEKEYDRQMAIKTLKLVKKLGYDIVKREETELYRILKERIKYSAQEFHCPACGHTASINQIFCEECGKKLNIDWSLYKNF